METPNNSSTTPWWTILISGENVEERSHILFDAGILGLEIKSPDSAQCYFSGSDTALACLKAEI